MFIEIEGYQGSPLLLQVAEIVSVSTHYDDEESKYYTAIRVKDDPVGEDGVTNSIDSAESYESIKEKIMKVTTPIHVVNGSGLEPSNKTTLDLNGVDLQAEWQDEIIKKNGYTKWSSCNRDPKHRECGDIHGKPTSSDLVCKSCALEGLYRQED